MNISVMKFADAVFGRIIACLFPKPAVNQKPATEPRSVLVIRPGGIGDAILLIPAIQRIKQMYPEAQIKVLAEKRNAPAFGLYPDVTTTFCYDSPMGLFQAFRWHYDVVIDTEQWYRLSAVVARLIRAPVKIGFATNERRRMLTHAIEYDQHAYETDNFLALLNPLGIVGQANVETPSLVVPHQSVSKTLQLLQPLGSESFVAIFPGASIPEKRWGTDRFRHVAEILTGFGIRTVVVGGKEDRQQGEEIAGGGVALNLAGLTSLPETAAVIQKSAMLVSGDSGVLHIAVGLGVPTVSLFGPGRTPKWAPKGEHHIVINKELPCSPCTTFGNMPRCPNNTRCMREITVDEVVNAVTMLLTSVGAMSSQCCKRDWIETR